MMLMELIGDYVKGTAFLILLGVVTVYGPDVLLFLFNEVL